MKPSKNYQKEDQNQQLAKKNKDDFNFPKK